MRTERNYLATSIALALSLALVATAGGFTTVSFLSDEERASTTMSAAERFSTETLVEVDHVLDVESATPDEWLRLEDGTIQWSITPRLAVSNVSEDSAESADSVTVAVDGDALLTRVGAPSYDTLGMTSADGSSVDFTVVTHAGTDWLRFQVDRSTTNDVLLAVVKPRQSSPGADTVSDAHNGSVPSATNATAQNGTRLESIVDDTSSITNDTVTDGPDSNGTALDDSVSAPSEPANGTNDETTLPTDLESSADSTNTSDGDEFDVPIESDGDDTEVTNGSIRTETGDPVETDGQSADEPDTTTDDLPDDGSTTSVDVSIDDEATTTTETATGDDDTAGDRESDDGTSTESSTDDGTTDSETAVESDEQETS
ncbi:MAG: hypothetical protein ACOCY7_02185, partial [Halodesulfurarchaeum sp.]